jgi:hypothetical protein
MSVDGAGYKRLRYRGNLRKQRIAEEFNTLKFDDLNLPPNANDPEML